MCKRPDFSTLFFFFFFLPLIFPALLLQMKIATEEARAKQYDLVQPGSAAFHDDPRLCHRAIFLSLSEL